MEDMAQRAEKNMGPGGPDGMPGMPPREEKVVVPPHEDYYKTADIVVLGGGGAGLVAAARISEQFHRSVIVVEKRRRTGGGASGAADWKVYGSRWQRDHGIPDNTFPALRQVMDETYWQLAPKLAYNTFRATGEFFDFLCDTGEGVESLYQEGTYIFDGPNGPKIPAFRKARKGGAYVMGRMLELCEKNNVEILVNTSVTDLDRDEAGYIITADDGGGKTFIRARACILATGSWIRNPEIVAKYCPKVMQMPMGDGGHTHPSYTGDGLAIAEKLGAKIDYQNFEIRLMGPLGMCQSQTLMSMAAETCTIWVNRNGKRWINESTQKRRGIFETGNKLIDQPGQTSFYIFDQGMIDACVRRFRSGAEYPWCFPAPPSYPEDYMADIECAFHSKMPPMPGMGKSIGKADTLAELARQMGIDAAALQETAAHYNEMCKDGADTEFFKDPGEMMPFTGGPYYAISGGMGSDGAFGGVLVNENIQAYREDGGLLDGFYVPGDFASGRFLNIQGCKVQIINDLAWAFASGWISAKSAADYVNSL